MFSVGIIGAGSIGALKPFHIDNPETKFPLTHAHAVYSHPEFKLEWIFDTDRYKSSEASRRWNCLGIQTNQYGEDHELNADVIVVATPTHTHLQTIETICQEQEEKPKLIILEKPAGNSLIEATRIDYLCKEAGIPVVVNYGRRFSNIISVFADVDLQTEGIQGIVFYYTRGMIRDGSHAIDMLNWFAGYFTSGYIIDSDPIIDYHSSDPTYAVRLKYSKCQNIFLIPVDGRLFDCFEMHVITNSTRFVFDEHFMKIGVWSSKEEGIYGDYHSLPSITEACAPCSIETDLKFSMQYLYDHVYNVLTKKEQPNKCNMTNAKRVHNVIEKLLIDKARKENE